MKTLRILFLLLLAMAVIYLPFIIGGGSVDFRDWTEEFRLAYMVITLVFWTVIFVSNAGIDLAEKHNQQKKEGGPS